MIKTLFEQVGIESPTKMRVQQLAERLFNLQNNLEQEKLSRSELFQAKLKSLESKIDSSCLSFDSKFKSLRDSFSKLSSSLASERASQDLTHDRKTKELKLVENSLNIDLNLLKQGRKEFEIKIAKLMDDRASSIRVDLAKEKKTREDVSEQQSAELSSSITRLTAVVDEESTARLEGLDGLNSHVQEEFQKFEDEALTEKRDRDEANSALVKMLEDMQERLLQELVNERTERENIEETLLKLLEETCQRVESSLRA
jgi:hypothetical protein